MRYSAFIAVFAVILALEAGCSKKMLDSEVFNDSKFAPTADEAMESSAAPPSSNLIQAPGTPAPGSGPVATPPAAAPPAAGGDGKLAEMAVSFGKKLTDLDNALNANDLVTVQKIANDLRADFDKIKSIKVIKTEASIANSVDNIDRRINSLIEALATDDSNGITSSKRTIFNSWQPLISWMRANANASVETDAAAPGDQKKPEGGEEKPGEKPAGDQPKPTGKSDWEDEKGDDKPAGGKAVPKEEKPVEGD
jgi:hypothetical protein